MNERKKLRTAAQTVHSQNGRETMAQANGKTAALKTNNENGISCFYVETDELLRFSDCTQKNPCNFEKSMI